MPRLLSILRFKKLAQVMIVQSARIACVGGIQYSFLLQEALTISKVLKSPLDVAHKILIRMLR